jgi:glycosyltransferase involved in cell wall biosynthesis
MKIAFNMLFVAPGVAGGRVYCEGLLRGLAAVDPANDYVIYTRRDTRLPDLPPERFRQVCAPVSGHSTVWRTFWEYKLLPRKVRRGGFQLFHGLGSLSPASRSCPFVLTIHDVLYRHFPRSLPLGYYLFMRGMHGRVARRADRVIVPSHCSAREAVELLGVSEDRIRLVPYGPGNGFQRVDDEGRVNEVLKKLGVRRPFVISVCRAYAHKNLAGLLRAFARLRDLGFKDVQLVLVGERYRTGAELDRLTKELGLEPAVVFTGFVSQEDLNALYSAATVFAFPSLAEGFGLPVLEAMACGAPVVGSKASAVPEAVGAAGLVADAQDPEAFADALARVLRDDALRAGLREKGLHRAREFSWERTAEGTLAVYRELAGGG